MLVNVGSGGCVKDETLSAELEKLKLVQDFTLFLVGFQVTCLSEALVLVPLLSPPSPPHTPPQASCAVVKDGRV